MDVHSIIKQFTKQLSESSKEEDRIRELQPIDYILDYYANSIKGCIDPRDNKEYILEWKDEDDRIKVIQRYNAIVNRYNAEVKNNEKEFNKLLPAGDKAYSPSDLNFNKPLDYFSLIPLWAFKCVPILTRTLTIDNEELFRMFYFEIKDKSTFIKRFNKTIFDYICKMLHEGDELGQNKEKSIWFTPSYEFLNWFQSKNYVHKSIQPLYKDKRKNKGGRKKGSSREMVSRIMWIRDRYQILKDKDSGENDKERAELIASEMRKLQSKEKLPGFFEGSVLKHTTVYKYIKTKRWKDITPKE